MNLQTFRIESVPEQHKNWNNFHLWCSQTSHPFLPATSAFE